MKLYNTVEDLQQSIRDIQSNCDDHQVKFGKSQSGRKKKETAAWNAFTSEDDPKTCRGVVLS